MSQVIYRMNAATRFSLPPAVRSWVRPRLGSNQFSILLTLWLALPGNSVLWNEVRRLRPGHDGANLLFLLAFLGLLLVLIYFVVFWSGFRWVQKPVATVLLVASALASYFMGTYGVLIDSTVIQNILETDAAEAGDLITPRLLVHLLLFGVLPALWCCGVRVDYRWWGREVAFKAGGLLVCIAIVGVIASTSYSNFASLLRNNPQLRHMALPMNYLYAVGKYAGPRWGTRTRVLEQVGLDAALSPHARAMGARRKLVVLVVGETARAQSLSLNGYGRKTNPKLEQRNVVSFDQVQACGTSTAVSLPCMFSDRGRDDYDPAATPYREGLLDVVRHAGVRVLWRENNSGCKGVCDRVETQDRSQFGGDEHCDANGCYDEVLLDGLDDYIESLETDGLIVLHQQGSHGPAYYRRYPEPFRRFTPTCDTSELQDCDRESIVNTYDNTILYTDFVLNQVIELLERESDRFDTAMIFVSDHGESLGENHVYLHGLPYLFAPVEQTQVPLVVWLSDRFRRQQAIGLGCLEARRHEGLTHDHLFHSVLGLLDLQTEVYDQGLDLFSACREPSLPS